MKKHYKIIAILFLLMSFVCSQVFAYTLMEKAKIDKKGMEKITGDKIFDFRNFSVSKETGNIFIIGMDNKTRQWEWYLINPAKKKLLKTGNCPFIKTWRFQLSPDSKEAFAVSKYNTALYHLDIESGKWKKMYKNPKRGVPGLAFRYFSKIRYISNKLALTMMELWDKKHFATDTVITAITPESQVPKKVVSLNELRSETAKIAKVDVKKYIYVNDYFIYSTNKNMAFILKTQNKSKGSEIQDYLFTRKPNGDLKMIESLPGGRIIPLYFDAESNKIIYVKADKAKKETILYEKGKKSVIMDCIMREADVMSNGLMGYARFEKKNQFSIYLGKPGEKLQKVKTFEEPYGVFFMNDGKHFIVLNKKLIRCFKIEDRS